MLAWGAAAATGRGESMNLHQADVVVASTLAASLAFGWYRPRRYYLPGVGALLFLLLMVALALHFRGGSAAAHFVQNEPWLAAAPFLGALAGLAAAHAQRPQGGQRRYGRSVPRV